MPVTVDEVRRIASLAGLRLSPEEERELVPQLRKIVRFADEMAAAPVLSSARAPSPELAEAPASPEASEQQAPDDPGPSLDRRLVLANAPDHGEGHVRLPPIHLSEES